ncbi:Gfo/Idh/MocA family protein [Sphingomonas carotinifaciens]|uniref:Gfo/Idh/MocA family oxidoreductase n=1 Tax=Sphingomonas carotinifaciens TaxID=1166323 RepID=A0A1G7QAV1_9SPHN|nr:Gfo/Idh/MocA family oxidoreductase [Sphingomonas carotinifaciens]MBB4087764.1 putative dehydrogenase [Sphingomonas carotinifaciens]MWC44871.1 gfo/Idh/MocA family oxidoreductase [Sphingomonas carotinifaciens]SDF95681.1 Predicted dehydrogenase [Sphingomonas carotinifaciens]
MSLASALGLGGKKVRYAMVGLGDITQSAMLPGVKHTGNSEVTALVSSDAEKLAKVGDAYGVEGRYRYDQFDALIASGTIDAIYIGTPNWRHAEFAVPALNAGIHVLCEKPLEVSAEQARAILAAEKAGKAKLMTAYRLHFEPATLDAIRRIRAGELGDVLAFTSCFGQMLDPANHRAHHGIEAGPLFDMGAYPINAIRYLFGAEPVEVVSAVGTRHPEAGFGDLDDTITVTLRLPGDRFAQFVVSYYLNGVETLTIAGTKGSITLNPAYTFGKSLEQIRTIGQDTEHQVFNATDQFGGEMKYFSDCILEDRTPEPDGEEGLADILVIEAVVKALKSGGPVAVEPLARSRRIDPDAQEQRLSPVSPPETVNADSPTR